MDLPPVEPKDGVYDIAVIGGGPAGAHAAAKAALLFRTCVLFDKGRRFSRIYWSPKVDNLPGRFGVPGREVVASGHAMIEAVEEGQGRRFVDVHEDTSVTALERDGEGFVLRAQPTAADQAAKVQEVRVRHVVLATGATDRQPRLADFRRRDIEAVLPFANKGLADYCLLCDGHTVAGKRVAVLGCSPDVRGIAKSLKKNFGADTALVPMCNVDQHEDGMRDPKAAWSDVEDDLAKWDIPILFGGVKAFTGIKDGRFGIVFEDGTEEHFDKAWIAMGWYAVQSGLAKDVGARLDADGFVVTDADGRVLDEDDEAIPGLYAIGDVRAGSWKQIPIAWGQAEAAVIDAFVHGRPSRR